jgi:hypothetical protein
VKPISEGSGGGHRWSFATHKADVAPEELRRRHEALAKQQSSAVAA